MVGDSSPRPASGSGLLAPGLLLVLAAGPQRAVAYYCDHDLCSSQSEQYCCGDNLCCDYSNSWWSWYLWLSILFVVILISLLWALYRLFCFDHYENHRDLLHKVVHKFLKKATKASATSCPSSSASRWLEDPESSLLGGRESPKSGDGKDGRGCSDQRTMTFRAADE